MRADEQTAISLQLETLGKLAPSIAHDINNLLSGILGYSQIIISDPSADGLKSCAEEIEKAGKRISGLVRLLQVFNQRQFLHEELLDLNQVIQELEKYLLLLAGKDIHFSVQKGPKLLPIRADKSRIRQALLLWFSSIKELMPGGGEIKLGTENFVSASGSPEAQFECKQEVRIQTAIRGNPDFNSSFSDPSYNAEGMSDSSQKAKQATTCVAEIIDLCGGRITYSNPNEGGLSFNFYFPAEASTSSD
jgi:K+-sensing histidine kinase KdpD